MLITLETGEANSKGDADEIHLDDLSKFVERLPLDGTLVGDAGVVDQHIEAA